AGVAAALCLPARERLERFANRLVYGERHAPDEVLRTFGSRLSRAVPLDELLLQMVESLRKTLALQAAEVWTGSNGLLERTVSVPELGAARVSLNASDQARRQIERNLHDGAQQHLVALAVNVRLARQLADADPEQAKLILDELGGELQDAVQELRELAHGIYPPLLMDQGLTAALRAAAGRSPL